MGKPVALEASAEERLTRGFISIMMRRPVLGSIAHCTLDPPVSTPMASMTFKESSRMAWYARSSRLWIGATVMESPVCTPMGSRFSMEHTITALPFLSRMTSISNSFQPSSDSSIRTSLLSDASKPRFTMVSNSSGLWAIPPPVPPRVKPGRIISGQLPMV